MEFLRTPYAQIQVKDGILYFTYLPISNFNIQIAKQVVADRLKVQGEISYPILCDIRQLNFPDLEARRYLAIEGSILTKAVAYLNSPTSDHLTHFFVRVDQPVVPTKLCTSQDEALEFLNAFVK
ncbi:MAG TPA: hypothetical protein ENH91_04150 [Leeuwenhoekiella sp.]|nr:hypothetical protein [Leeuwenhoekiella sp.]